MTKIKVLDIAREVGIEDDKLLLKLKRMGVKVKDKKPAELEKKVSPSDEKIIERNSEKEITEKRVKPTVIRRRTRSLELKVEPLHPSIETTELSAPPQIEEEKLPETIKEKTPPIVFSPPRGMVTLRSKSAAFMFFKYSTVRTLTARQYSINLLLSGIGKALTWSIV